MKRIVSIQAIEARNLILRYNKHTAKGKSVHCAPAWRALHASLAALGVEHYITSLMANEHTDAIWMNTP